MVSRNATFRFLLDIKDFVSKGRLVTRTIDNVNQKTTQASASMDKMAGSTQRAGQAATTAAVNFQTATQGMLNLSTAGIQTFTSFSNLDRAGNRLAQAQIGLARANDLLSAKELRLAQLREKSGADVRKISQLEQEIATARADLIVKTDKLKIEEGALLDIQLLFVANIANVMISSIQTIVTLRNLEIGSTIKQIIQQKLLARAYTTTSVSTVGYKSALGGMVAAQNTAALSARGLLVALGPIGLALGAVSVGVLAYQENWYGFGDAVRQVLPFLEDKKRVLNEVNEELGKSGDAIESFVQREKIALDKSNQNVTDWAVRRFTVMQQALARQNALMSNLERLEGINFHNATGNGGTPIPFGATRLIHGLNIFSQHRINQVDAFSRVPDLSSRFTEEQARGFSISLTNQQIGNFPSLDSFRNQIDRLIQSGQDPATVRLLIERGLAAQQNQPQSFAQQAAIAILQAELQRIPAPTSNLNLANLDQSGFGNLTGAINPFTDFDLRGRNISFTEGSRPLAVFQAAFSPQALRQTNLLGTRGGLAGALTRGPRQTGVLGGQGTLGGLGLGSLINRVGSDRITARDLLNLGFAGGRGGGIPSSITRGGSRLAGLFAGSGAARDRRGGHSVFRGDRAGGAFRSLRRRLQPQFGEDLLGRIGRAFSLAPRPRGRETQAQAFARFQGNRNVLFNRLSRVGNIRGRIGELFPLTKFTFDEENGIRRLVFSDLPTTVSAGLGGFDTSLDVLESFRNEVLQFAKLTFEEQSKIELDITRERNELRDRVNFGQRLEAASTGLSGI